MNLIINRRRSIHSQALKPVRFAAIALLCLLIIAAVAEPAFACPTCKDTLGLHAIRIQMGYALSIGFMMAVPFGIIAAWTIAIYRMVKNQKALLAQSSSSNDDNNPRYDDPRHEANHQTTK